MAKQAAAHKVLPPGRRKLFKPRAECAVAMIFRAAYGEGTGGTLVRRGVNDAIAQLSPEERARLDINPIPENGRLDQRAFDTFRTLDAEGYGELVRGSIADQRKARVEENSPPNRQRGELARVDHFR